MYQAETDPYCYPNSSVLKNKAGLTNQAALEEYETAMTFARSLEPLPPGRFSVSHYRAVHHHLFQDVYGPGW
jgi:cell filamentation protein